MEDPACLNGDLAQPNKQYLKKILLKKEKKKRRKGGERKETKAGMKEHKQWKSTKHKMKWKNKFK